MPLSTERTKMEDLNLAATQSTPSIVSSWQAGTLHMQGDSFPENSFAFFEPVVAWALRYLKDNTAPLRLDLQLLYLNTSSVKIMIDLFDLLEEAHANGRAVAVNWYYDLENERIAELAEEFREDYTFPFAIDLRTGSEPA